ncbi:MAG: exodeoxyribonuclease VII small subunit [Gammaproteobacteria bacterium]|nr:exodeoxyribonuclease VII small subunit [Gammaproteobacteria bacterium]
MSPAKKKDTSDFEQSLIELEKIVERMERGEQSLDETISDFERGMTLSDQCQKNLDSAQLKVEKLIKKHEKYQLESHEYEPEADNP